MKKVHPDSRIRFLPLITLCSFYLFVLAIFWFGPIDWPVQDQFLLLFYQIIILLSIVIGYYTGSYYKISNKSIESINFSTPILVVVLLLQIPLTLTYTGKYPWEFIDTIFNQRDAYTDMLYQIDQLTGQRFYVPLFRALLAPFFLLAIIDNFFRFNSLGLIAKTLFITALFCPLNLSILRGTDKEIFDFLFILCIVYVIRFYRNRIHRNVKDKQPRNSNKIIYVSLLSSFIFISIFTHRKFERMDGVIPSCMFDGIICQDFDGLITFLPYYLQFSLVTLAAYIGNGFYGLSLALEQPFDFSYFIGHSPALISLFDKLFNFNVFDSTYTYKISQLGWDHRFFWATAITWISNDFTFYGAVFVTFLFGRYFSQSWIDAVYTKNIYAVSVFVLVSIFFVYLPANNQIGNTLDFYFMAIFCFVMWKLSKLNFR